MTVFSVVTSGVGADLSIGVILIIGLAKMISDGIAMGLGDYLGSKAEVIRILKLRMTTIQWNVKGKNGKSKII